MIRYQQPFGNLARYYHASFNKVAICSPFADEQPHGELKMLKQILIMSAAAFSFPALAQVTDPQDPSAQAPVGSTDQMKAPGEAAPMGTAPAAKPATAEQVSAIVDQEFVAYDSDANGELNQTEFAAWMEKLRAASPQTPPVADAAAWSAQAFKMADADSSASITKAELVAFLSRAK